MLAKKECLQCLKKLSLLAIDLSICAKPGLKTQTKSLQKVIINRLNLAFSTKKVPAAIFSGINRKIKKLTAVKDSFSLRKKREMDISRLVALKTRANYKNSLQDLLAYSAAGNSLDFFKKLNTTARQMQKPIYLRKNSLVQFRKILKEAKTILFFADNSGEAYFDLPLVKYLAKTSQIYYVVKSRPVQNDLTLQELKKSGLGRKFPRITGSGNDAVGIELKSLTKSLAKKLQTCDLVIAKGMGYYETFSELPQYKHKVFHLLMAKCNPVAKSLGVKKNDYVFLKR